MLRRAPRCAHPTKRPTLPYKPTLSKRFSSSSHSRSSHDGQRVWSWGANENGVLGVGDNKDRTEPTLIPELRRQTFISLSASWSMSMIINNRLQTYSWGKTGAHLLQPGRRDSTLRVPAPCEPIQDKQIIKIFCGRTHALGLTAKGDVLSWGTSELGQRGHGVEGENQELWLPAPIDQLCQQDIVQLACGLDHCLALSKDGRIWSWGYGEDGQLGHGAIEDTLTRPKLLESTQIDGKQVADIVCGADFSAVLLRDGTVLTFGSNYFGQLGHGDTHDRSSPTPVATLMGMQVVELAAGAAHILARTKDREVYACGWGEHGRLGLGSNDDRMQFTLIEALSDRKVSRIWAGGGHSYALTDEGRLLTWGLGENGRLGLGDLRSVSEPTELSFFNDKRIIHLACGLEHTVAVTD